MRRFNTALGTLLITLTAVSSAEAYLDCGRVAMRLTGSSCGSPLARAWAVNCKHTYARAGAVVVSSRRGMDASGKRRGGHVAVIVAVRTNCRAVVHDEKGIYERDICKNRIAIVEP